MTKPQALKIELLQINEQGDQVEKTEAPVTIEFSEIHIRVIFGEREGDGPDIYIERRSEGFDIAIHPDPGDPEIIIESRDAGHAVFDDGVLFGDKQIAFIPSRRLEAHI